MYALRTVILPFGWIFNPQLLLKLWENALLLASVVLLFRPDFFMDQIAPEYKTVAAQQVFEVAKSLPANERLVLNIKGTTIEGKDVSKTVAIPMGEAQSDGRRRIQESGASFMGLGDEVQISAVKFGSRAGKAGLTQGLDIAAVQVKNTERPSPHWFYLPALALIALVWWNQQRRMSAP